MHISYRYRCVYVWNIEQSLRNDDINKMIDSS